MKIENGVLHDVLFYDIPFNGRFEIPDGVEKIGDGAFRGYKNLTSVVIPASVKCIGNFAFEGCTSLTYITIPESVESIGNFAFWKCTGLTTVMIGNGVTSFGDKAFYGCTGLKCFEKISSKTTYSDMDYHDFEVKLKKWYNEKTKFPLRFDSDRSPSEPRDYSAHKVKNLQIHIFI